MKKIIALMLVFAVTLSGCGNTAKTADEVLKEAYKNFLKEESYESSMEVVLDVEDEELSEELKAMTSMIDGAKVVATAKMNRKDTIMLDLNMEANVMGQMYKVMMYLDQEDMMFKLDNELLAVEYEEFIGKYIVMNMKELEEKMKAEDVNMPSMDINAEIEKSLKMANDNYAKVIDSLKDRLVLTEIENGYEISLDVTMEDMRNYFNEVMKLSMEDEKVIENLKLSYDDENLTDEELKDLYLDTIKDTFDKAEAALTLAGVNIDMMKITYILDEKSNFTGSKFDAKVSVNSAEKVVINLNATSAYKGFGEDIVVTKPELTEENSINYIQMIGTSATKIEE